VRPVSEGRARRAKWRYPSTSGVIAAAMVIILGATFVVLLHLIVRHPF
jgi:hypothetical protein